MKKILQLSNGIAFLTAIVINYLSNIGIFNGNTIADVSAEYKNVFTPAEYAFSIWGLIYFGLLVFVIYQGRSLFRKTENDKAVVQVGWWFVVSCIANSIWVITWVHAFIGLSVLIMLVLLFSLIQIILRTNMEKEDASLKTIAFVWWPFSLYSGWITIALFANIAAWLTKINRNALGISEISWAIILICIAGAINLFMTWNRNMREFALVGVWAFVAVAVKNSNEVSVIVQTAIAMATILFISSGIHVFKNRKKHI